jgi:hypothetical protein
MKNQILILITLFYFLCSKDKRILIYISNSNYELNLKTEILKLTGIIIIRINKLSKMRKPNKKKLIFKYNVDTFKSEKMFLVKNR